MAKEEKMMEHGMRLRHQKSNSVDKDQASSAEIETSSKSKAVLDSGDIKDINGKATSATSSESESIVTPPCLIPAAEPDNSSEQHSPANDPPSLQAHVSDSKDDSEMNNWRSLPRRAKRPAPASPVRKPPKKRGRPKVCFFV